MDLAALFDSFYSKFVLRDLFGKIVPGILLILGVCIGILGVEKISILHSKMTFATWIIVGGFSWLLGFVVKYIGEKLHLLRTHPKNIDKTRKEFFPDLHSFHKNSTTHEKVHAERLNIIKEAVGNGAISLLLSSAIIPTSLWIYKTPISSQVWLSLLLSVFAAFCLWRMHIEHVERFGSYICNANSHRSHDEQR